MANNEQLYGPVLRGPLMTDTKSTGSHWAGISAVLSGTATYVASTTAAASDSIVRFGARTSVASHLAIVLNVGSISPGASVTFALDRATTTSDYTIMWEIVRTS